MSELQEYIFNQCVEDFQMVAPRMNREETQAYLEKYFSTPERLEQFVIDLLADRGVSQGTVQWSLWHAIIDSLDFFELVEQIHEEIKYDSYWDAVEEDEEEAEGSDE